VLLDNSNKLAMERLASSTKARVDAELVRRAQCGDTEAFTRLAGALTPAFLSIAHRILRDIQLAEDATQQALVSCWQRLPQLREPDHFEAWAQRSLVHACYREERIGRRSAQVAGLFGSDEPRVTNTSEVVIAHDAPERAFRRLSVEHRAVVVLRHYRQLSIDEIAAVLRVPAGTVASRLHYALRILWSAMEADARPVHGRVVS
jgi:RNA polymerase sigma-70 factor (ECF subfamily)